MMEIRQHPLTCPRSFSSPPSRSQNSNHSKFQSWLFKTRMLQHHGSVPMSGKASYYPPSAVASHHTTTTCRSSSPSKRAGLLTSPASMSASKMPRAKLPTSRARMGDRCKTDRSTSNSYLRTRRVRLRGAARRSRLQHLPRARSLLLRLQILLRGMSGDRRLSIHVGHLKVSHREVQRVLQQLQKRLSQRKWPSYPLMSHHPATTRCLTTGLELLTLLRPV